MFKVFEFRMLQVGMMWLYGFPPFSGKFEEEKVEPARAKKWNKHGKKCRRCFFGGGMVGWGKAWAEISLP